MLAVAAMGEGTWVKGSGCNGQRIVGVSLGGEESQKSYSLYTLKENHQ